MRFYWPIAKIDAEQRMVWGYASTEALDEQGEIVKREALDAALADYMRFANIREMHQPSAIGVALLATISTYPAANVQAIREGQLEWIAANPTFAYLGLVPYDGIHASGDGLHFPNAQMQRFGRRWALGMAKSAGWSAIGADGPQIASVAAAGGSADVDVTITQNGGTALLDGTGSSAGTGLVGFIATINGTPVTINSTAFVSGKVRLTLASAPASGDTVGVQYGYGNNPWGWAFLGADTDDHIVYDNQSALIGDTTGFPLQPTVGTITTTAT